MCESRNKKTCYLDLIAQPIESILPKVKILIYTPKVVFIDIVQDTHFIKYRILKIL